jgi:hypothetical protein
MHLMTGLLARRPEDAWLLPDLEQERLSRPFQHQRRWKGRGSDACRPSQPDRLRARAVLARGQRTRDTSMPMPHRTFAQWRSAGSSGRRAASGSARSARSWPSCPTTATVRTRTSASRSSPRSRTPGPVERGPPRLDRRPAEGAAQIALVGPPNVGKSSLLQALSEIQIKTGDYAFTTLRPVPALTRIHGALVQLVEIPGLIEGAAEDRGGGRALLGVLRSA